MSTAFCFDLDGTISSVEILPCIAAELGVSEEIASLTRLTMDGLIPFPSSLRLRSLLLGQVPVPRVHEIIDSIPLNPDILDFIAGRVDRCFVVTGNLDLWMTPLLKRLPCTWFSSRARYEGSHLRVISPLDKSAAVREIRQTGRFARIVAIGDGANDAPMLLEADVSIAYGGVHAPADSAIKASQLVVNDAGALCKTLMAL